MLRRVETGGHLGLKLTLGARGGPWEKKEMEEKKNSKLKNDNQAMREGGRSA